MLPLSPNSGRLLAAAFGSIACLLFDGCAGTADSVPAPPKSAVQGPASAAPTETRDKSGATQLIKAARKGKEPKIQALVEAGADVNAVDRDGYTALMYLVDDGDYRDDAVELLLRHHADPNLSGSPDDRPLVLAASKSCEPKEEADQLRLLTLLIGAGANANLPNSEGLYPLQMAAASGEPGPCLDILRRATGEAQRVDSVHGYSDLSEAALGDHRASEDYLIAEGELPQDLRPAEKTNAAWPPQVDDTFAITARACESYGDFLQSKGRSAEAQDAWHRSQDATTKAIAEYSVAFDAYSKALAAAKDKRRQRWVAVGALDVLGVGLGAATGVGVVFVPKRDKNLSKQIDDDSDAVDRLKEGLVSLRKEQIVLATKVTPPPEPPQEAAVAKPTSAAN